MSNDKDSSTDMEISINYGERNGLKSSKSRSFKTDQIVLFLNGIPQFEIKEDNLQFPSYIRGDIAMTEDDRDQLVLDYLMGLYRNAQEEIKKQQEIREIERKKAEADKQKELANSLSKYLPTKQMKEE